MTVSTANSVEPLLGPLGQHSSLTNQTLLKELKLGPTGSRNSRSALLGIIVRFLTLTHEYWLSQKQQYLMTPNELARSHPLTGEGEPNLLLPVLLLSYISISFAQLLTQSHLVKAGK